MGLSSHPWLVLCALSALYFLDNFDRYLVSVSPIPYIDYDSYEYALLTGTIFAICYTVGGVAIAVGSDAGSLEQSIGKTGYSHYARILAICLGTLVFSAAFFSTAYATTFAQQAAIRMIMGFAQSIITPFSCGLLAALFPTHLHGLAFGIFNVGTYFAFSGAISLGTYMYDEYGWQRGYQLFGALGVALAALVATCAHVAEKRREVDRPPSDYIPMTSTSSNSTSSHGLLSNSEALISLELASNPGFLSRCRSVLVSSAAQWTRQPMLFLICVAGGVRLGGGYVWSAYTAPFFSELFTYPTDSQSCSFSYNVAGPYPADACSSDFPYCVSGSCAALGSSPWHNEGLSHTILESYMSWVPLAGSAMGTVLGGVFADKLVRLTTSRMPAATMRLLLCGAGGLAALPAVVSAFLLPSPGCFWVMVGSGFVGELYLGQTLAVVAELSDPALVVTAVALFMLCATLIGGNAPLLVPWARRQLVSSGYVDDTAQFSFSAASIAGSENGEVKFSVQGQNAYALGYALVCVQAALYALSSLVYLIAAGYLARRGVYTRADIDSRDSLDRVHLDKATAR